MRSTAAAAGDSPRSADFAVVSNDLPKLPIPQTGADYCGAYGLHVQEDAFDGRNLQRAQNYQDDKNHCDVAICGALMLSCNDCGQ